LENSHGKTNTCQVGRYLIKASCENLLFDIAFSHSVFLNAVTLVFPAGLTHVDFKKNKDDAVGWIRCRNPANSSTRTRRGNQCGGSHDNAATSKLSGPCR